MTELCVSTVGTPAVRNVLNELRPSDQYAVPCSGGDFSLPTVGKQHLRSDINHHGMRDPCIFSKIIEVKVCWLILIICEAHQGLRESHHRFMRRKIIPEAEPTSLLAFHGLWHGGSPNDSHQYLSDWGRGCCPSMLSVHYVAFLCNE